MSYFDNIKTPNGTGKKQTGSYFDRIKLPKDQARANRIFGYQTEDAESGREAKRLNSFGNIAKETAKGVGRVPVNTFKNLIQIYEQTPKKFAKNTQEAADDIVQGLSTGNQKQVAKGVYKASVRNAGDFAIAVFAPFSAAIGALLEGSGGQKLIDKAGEIIADKSGITDMPKFQKFAMEHPNAGEDFDRILNLLTLGSAGKTKINPKQMAAETQNFYNKITTTQKPTTSTPGAKESTYFERIVVPKSESSLPVEAPIRQSVPTLEGNTRRSGLASTLERDAVARGIEADFGALPEYQTRNMSLAADRAMQLITENLDQAKRIIEGKEAPPPDVLVGDVFSALKVQAIKSGDVNSVIELSRSKANDIATRLGQEVKAFDARLDNDPIRVIREIVESREKGIVKQLRTGDIAKAKTQTRVKIETEIAKTVPKVKTWEEFINSLEC